MIADSDPQASWADSVDDADVHMSDNADLLADTPDPASYADVTSRPRPRPCRSSVSSVQSWSSAADPDFQRLRDQQTSFESDNFHVLNTLPDRPYSAFINLEKDKPVTNIFADVRASGIPISSIRCIQRNSNGSAFITFSSEERRNLYLKKSSFIPRNHPSDDSDFVFVAVYDAPYELPDAAIKFRLSQYGSVFSSRRCKLQGYPDVYNGIRVFKCVLSTSVPSFLRFGRFLVRVKHPNQVPTCRKCNFAGHVVKECPYQICFNCENIGHVSRDCLEEDHCSICRKTGHYAIDCEYSWNRRPARHTANEDEFPPPPSAFQEQPSWHAPDVPDSEDIIPPTQPSQPMQSSQPLQPSQSSPPLQPSQSSQPLHPSQPSVPPTTDSDVLLAAAASSASAAAAVVAALPSPDVVASSEPSPSQSSGSSTSTSATSSGSSSSSSSSQPTSCPTVPSDVLSQDDVSSSPVAVFIPSSRSCFCCSSTP